MTWQLQWGGSEYEKFFKTVQQGEGRPHPAVLRKPALRGDCIRYYDAFRFLGASRMWSQVGPQPIQISEIESYLRMSGVEDENTKLKYLRLIQKMDRIELNHIHAKSKK